MRRKPLNDLVLSVVAFCVAVGPAAAQGVGESLAPLDEAALQGEFASDGGCESQPGPSYFNRVYHFALDGTWRMVRTIYADPACGRPLLTLRLAGTYSLGQASQTVTGAREAALSFDLIHVMLQDEAALRVPAFALITCGSGPWKAGLEKDVGGTGCLGFKPLAECSVDHDIAQIRDDVLYPGVRTPDMCTPEGRPTALQPTGARRVTG